MNDNGYVYVLINPSMPNLVKIGKTTREPIERAKELSSTTGVPVPFIVVYDNFFENCSKAEKYIHTLLENKGFRISTTREFFEISVKDAIDTVIHAKEHFGEFQKTSVKNNSTDEIFYSDMEYDKNIVSLSYLIHKENLSFFDNGETLTSEEEFLLSSLKIKLKGVEIPNYEKLYLCPPTGLSEKELNEFNLNKDVLLTFRGIKEDTGLGKVARETIKNFSIKKRKSLEQKYLSKLKAIKDRHPSPPLKSS